MSRVTPVAALIFCLSGFTLYAGSQAQDEQLSQRVFFLTQQCDDSRVKDELLVIVSEMDTLLGEIEKSHHAKKKLFVIRLKKSRSMCQYFLQLQGE